ncbi:MAG: LptA/OstA family protein, partial [Acidobacteriota bacterium]
LKNGTLKAEYASYDQLNEKADLKNDVHITADLANGRANAKAARGTVYLVEKIPDGRDLNRFELFDNVEINSEQEGQAPTQINAGYAQYEKTADRFDLKHDVHIIVADRSKPVDIRAGSAVYEQKLGKVFLDGSAQVTQGPESISGEHIYTELFPSRSIKYAKVTGGARLKQTADDRITEVQANELNAVFDGQQTLTDASAVGSSSITLIPTQPNEYTKVTMTAPNRIAARFKGRGAIDKIETDGRTTIALDAPDGSADAANKRVTADTVRTSFDQAGKNISRAEAIGSAELAVEPRHPADSTYSTLVTAPKFDCTFFPTGNNAKLCVASNKAKAVRTPSVAGSPRGKQTLSADTLQASFSQQTKDVERFDASGSAKFTEKDRNAIASDISFRPLDSIVKLRGGEPTVWDSSARAKAAEINWDTRAEKSSMSGGVSTTYYSQRQSGGATPFGQSEKPVFVTASQAEFDHRAESAVFEGNARGWQENNYVRADKFLIQQREGRFFAEGNVQSLLYNAKRKENGKETTVPVYAASQKMQYDRDGRVLKYDTSVDLRQGTDRISAGSATISLSSGGDVEKTLVENNVVITQPGRKAQGDFAQFLASDESVTLRGSPARVEDAQNGSSQGAQLTMNLRDNKIESEGRTNQNSSGRTRSVYKVNNN